MHQATGVGVMLNERSDTLAKFAWTVVVLLWPVAALNYLDRQMLAAMKFSVMESNLDGRTPDGLLARFSLADTEPERGLRTLQEFVAELDRAAGPKLQDILFARHV